nr:4-alpha-glucanotransferase [Eubacterium sp.]
PYQSFSTFAGNPYFISLQELEKKGYLTQKVLTDYENKLKGPSVFYGDLYERRFPLLKKAFWNSKIEMDPDYQKFIRDKEEWLSDYALFMAIKDSKNGISYLEWEEDIRLRKPEALEEYREKLAGEINFYQFLQYEFHCQWKKLKAYANDHGVEIIGDIPIYVALDSADTWAHPELFQFDPEGQPTKVAGCPPDAFSATGQLWGNPLYQWEAHQKENYAWWLRRIQNCFGWYDVVRIDHFRGFDEYYAIPYGDKTAEFGSWQPGPGLELFNVLKEELGSLPIIAEDLGFLTDSVRKLLEDTAYPGMKILQFAFDGTGESDYLPFRYEKNSVVYTGTHDNTTTLSWWREMPEEGKRQARAYMNVPKRTSAKKMVWNFIRLAMSSVSDLCIIPIQDYLELSKEARINTPSTLGGNWTWRMEKNAMTDHLCQKIYEMTRDYGRLNLEDKKR